MLFELRSFLQKSDSSIIVSSFGLWYSLISSSNQNFDPIPTVDTNSISLPRFSASFCQKLKPELARVVVFKVTLFLLSADPKNLNILFFFLFGNSLTWIWYSITNYSLLIIIIFYIPVNENWYYSCFSVLNSIPNEIY